MKHIVAAFGLMLAPLAAQEPRTWTTAEDHRNMMEQLGIRTLRPGPSGNPTAPNQANYDESKANPFPILPDALTLKNGTKVATAAVWWKQRRSEIVEEFEREILGRIPHGVPQVQWRVVSLARGTLAGRPVIGKQLVGRVDSPTHPALGVDLSAEARSAKVDIRMTLVTPENPRGRVPVMIMFGSGVLPQALGGPAPARRGGGPPAAMPAADPPATEQLIAAGWGFASLSPASIQADNGAGLTRGIIGLVNKGQPRKPDDWGSLRAWAWGASRALDYLETEPAVDAARVGIEGVSRYGKAALVTMAFDRRFAVVLVGSSGEGGAKLHRRNFGESVENLTAPNEYNQKEKMPPVNVGLLDGQLAWRQHDGGHTDGPNWKYFIPWADKMLGR